LARRTGRRICSSSQATGLSSDDLVSREIKLDEINEAYAELANGKIARSVITSF